MSISYIKYGYGMNHTVYSNAYGTAYMGHFTL